MVRASSKSSKIKSSITLEQAQRIELDERRRFLAYIQHQILQAVVELYESGLGKGLVAYGRITAYRDLLYRLEDVTGKDFGVTFVVKVNEGD